MLRFRKDLITHEEIKPDKNNKSPTTLVQRTIEQFRLGGSSGTWQGVGLLNYSAKSARVQALDALAKAPFRA